MDFKGTVRNRGGGCLAVGGVTHARTFDTGILEGTNPYLRGLHMKPTFEPSVEPSTVSLAEAAKLLAKPENTIREWIKSSKLPAHRDPRGRWLIKRHDLMSFAVTRGSVEPRPGATSKAASKERHHAEGSVEGLVEPSNGRYVRSLEAMLEREQRINDELRAKVLVLEQERTQHMAEMRALLSRDVSGKEGVLSRWIRR